MEHPTASASQIRQLQSTGSATTIGKDQLNCKSVIYLLEPEVLSARLATVRGSTIVAEATWMSQLENEVSLSPEKKPESSASPFSDGR